MTTVTVELPFTVTREHELLLRAADQVMSLTDIAKLCPTNAFPTSDPLSDLIGYGMVGAWHGPSGMFVQPMPLGRAVLAQCPSLWEPDELEAKLREMAG